MTPDQADLLARLRAYRQRFADDIAWGDKLGHGEATLMAKHWLRDLEQTFPELDRHCPELGEPTRATRTT